ncbi:hypothetical protein T4D_10418 [Trichinella pseudospiralis]|uniref:Uncharacterized protein n=1 Tax=Trichinella pseudospiralis TaxID=6337 RepID=A0A0V1FSW8_TRIPS|nr:hypothetical protein T4D_10418 [Trichinella pseudospiralis]
MSPHPCYYLVKLMLKMSLKISCIVCQLQKLHQLLVALSLLNQILTFCAKFDTLFNALLKIPVNTNENYLENSKQAKIQLLEIIALRK